MKINKTSAAQILLFFLFRSGHAQVISKFMSDPTRPASYIVNAAPDYNNGFIFLSESPDSTFNLNTFRFAINWHDRDGTLIQSFSSDDLATKRVLLTSDHGYLFSSDATQSLGQVIFKTDSLFNIQWSKKIRPIDYQQNLFSVLVESGGFYYAQYFIYSPDSALAILKIDSAGNLLNSRVVADSLNVTLQQFDLCASAEGGIYYVSRGGDRSSLVKLDSGLNFLWSRTYYGSSRFVPRVIKCFSDSCVMVSGELSSSYLIMKVDPNGNTVFAKSLSSPGIINFRLDPTELPNGNIALSGYILDSQFSRKPLLLKIDAMGNLLTANAYNFGLSATRFMGNFLDAATDSVYIFGEYFEQYAIPGAKNFFFRADTTLTGLCNETLPTVSCVNVAISDSAYVPQDSTGAVYLQDTLISFYAGGMQVGDFCGLLNGVNEKESGVFTIFPDPFTSSATLELKYPVNGAMFQVYNSMGILVRREEITGSTINIARDRLISGLYYLEVIGPENRLIGNGKFIVE